MNKPLRFAPLIRVSTEQQKDRGESLNTQQKMILGYVERLGGTIPERCWEYCGQEHATPGQERQKLDKLLADAERDIFDAVIVTDASRWSRDNEKNKAGLRILRQNGILFFVGGMEYDLHNSEQCLFLGLAAEINEFHAKQQRQKSLINRMERARKGYPSAGKLPYARTFDHTTKKWGIDEEKAKNIRWAADQYLYKGKSIVVLAKTLGMNISNFWKVITKRAGEDWEISFDDPEFKISETITMKIPRLLPDETIHAIHERAKANKTYTHGEIKNQYLLSRMAFCADCGNAMFGQTNHGNRRYYRHARGRLTPCDPSLWIPAEALESAVLVHLFSLFGDVAAMERAITRAIPDHSKLTVLREEKEELESKLTNVQREKQNLIRTIAKGILSDAEASQQLKEIRERDNLISSEIDRIAPQLENLPTRKHIERSAKLVHKVITSAYSQSSRLSEMSYEDRRELVQRAFAGKDAEGHRMGVYVRKSDNPERPWEFTIKGILAEFVGLLPLAKHEIAEILGDDEKETSFALYCTGGDLP
jgi:site-specific DNA recombinase